MRYKDTNAQLIKQWQLKQIESMFLKNSVLLTVSIFSPGKMLKGATLTFANEKAAPLLEEYMERYRKRLLRVLYTCRFSDNLEALALPFFGVVETANKHGSPCGAHIHFLLGISKKQRKELFSVKKNGNLNVSSKPLSKEISKLNQWLKVELIEKGLEQYIRLDIEHCPHDGENLDYLTKNVDQTIEHVVMYPEKQSKEKHPTKDGDVNIHFHNPPSKFTLIIER